GFDNCVMCDALGHVAELANSNLFIVKDGIVHTPVANGTFLAGITRNRVIALLRNHGVEVRERSMHYSELESADEIFSTGNFAKVLPANRIGARQLEAGPIYR